MGFIRKSWDLKPLLQGTPWIILLGQEKRKEPQHPNSQPSMSEGDDSEQPMPQRDVEVLSLK
jgi:hypothetical protein